MRSILFLVMCLLALPLSANPASPVNTHVTHAALTGKGSLSVFFLHVYDAELYAPSGEWSYDKPFALVLRYARTIEGNDIADRSAEEIRKLGLKDEIKLAAWHNQMRTIFPDVTPGVELTGVYSPGKATRFYRGDTLIGEVKDTEFGRWFFDIWLSENTSEPGLRKGLLGL